MLIRENVSRNPARTNKSKMQHSHRISHRTFASIVRVFYKTMIERSELTKTRLCSIMIRDVLRTDVEQDGIIDFLLLPEKDVEIDCRSTTYRTNHRRSRNRRAQACPLGMHSEIYSSEIKVVLNLKPGLNPVSAQCS